MASRTSLLRWLMHRRSPFGLFWKSLRHDFNWRGRASVAEFWNFVLFVVLILAVTVGGLQFVGSLSVPEQTEQIGFLIVFLMLLPPLVSVFVRRLHDTGRYALQGGLLLLLPGVGTVILLYLLVRPGLNYQTEFGVEPRYDGL